MPVVANRLINERSPYLRQHAQNPVDWRPWGDEAFEQARRENKPIFLSIGYSTCHWCHVMAQESFEDERAASLLNEHFISIKVDREERPDVDRVYMTFVQATTGSGGWPLSVWLTPDLKPFLGGTYFPPEERYGRKGFPEILLAIAEAWREQRTQIIEQGDIVVDALRKHTVAAAIAGGAPARGAADLQRGIDELWSNFDREWGGFGTAPKFPRPAVLRFIARAAAAAEVSTETRDRALLMLSTTLRKMAMGGMHDHVGGGFHRYSVDDAWHVPHFEKMLYDQGQLAIAYLEGFQLTGESAFADVVRDILKYVERDLLSPDGAFFSAEDADSPLEHDPSLHAEGAFYVWTKAEIAALLPPEQCAMFCRHYGVEPGGNADSRSDPHGEFEGKNILIERCPPTQTSSEYNLPLEEVNAILASGRDKLWAARGARPRPHLDDKILTGWNGLMISAFARAGQVLDSPAYLATARRAAEFIRTHLYDEKSGILRRSYREGAGEVRGFADDYAFLVTGLLDLYEGEFDASVLAWAERLQKTQDQLFRDTESGGYFSSEAGAPHILLRIKEDHDGAEPAPSSVAVLNLLRLAALTGRAEYRQEAERAAAAFASPPDRLVQLMPLMFAAQYALGTSPLQVVISGSRNGTDTREFLRAVRSLFLPHGIVLLADGGEAQRLLTQSHPYLAGVKALDGRATAYICRDFACEPPETDPQALAAKLKPKE
jgi:uncharacterized protein